VYILYSNSLNKVVLWVCKILQYCSWTKLIKSKIIYSYQLSIAQGKCKKKLCIFKDCVAQGVTLLVKLWLSLTSLAFKDFCKSSTCICSIAIKIEHIACLLFKIKFELSSMSVKPTEINPTAIDLHYLDYYKNQEIRHVKTND